MKRATHEESRERNLGIVINLMAVLFATIGLEIGSTRLGLSFGKILPGLDQFTVLLCDHLLLTTFFSLAPISRKEASIEVSAFLVGFASGS